MKMGCDGQQNFSKDPWSSGKTERQDEILVVVSTHEETLEPSVQMMHGYTEINILEDNPFPRSREGIIIARVTILNH